MDNHSACAGKKILFVDDETQILKSLDRLFFESDYEIFTADSGKMALDILEKEHIDLIITDMRMPLMDGYELLCKVKEKYPSMIRVILSGYSDEKIIVRALQKNIVKLYIFKPWDNNHLLKVIEQLFETEEVLKNTDLLSIINNVDGLPMLKSNYQYILQLIDSDADLATIAEAMEHDISLATKTLHIANSAFFGVKTGSIKQAVTYLGLSHIRNLLLSTSIIESLSVKSVCEKEVEYLWDHAFLCNKLVKLIFEKALAKKLTESEYSAGLLHNVGHVFLFKFFTEKYANICGKADIASTSILDAEQSLFTVTHQQTGGYLLQWWDLPFPIIETALYHHDPLNERIVNKQLVCVVNIAQYYANIILKKKKDSFLDYGVFEAIGTTPEIIETVIHNVSIN